MHEGHQRHAVGLGGIDRQIGRIAVDDRRARQQRDIVGEVGGQRVLAVGAELQQVDEHAGMALELALVEAQMRAEDEVDRVMAQPVLRQADPCAQPPEVVAEIACRVEQPERLLVAGGLDDAEMDVRQGHDRSGAVGPAGSFISRPV